MEWGWTWVGLIGLVMTGTVALLIFWLQGRTHNNWNLVDKKWKKTLDTSVESLESTVIAARDEVYELGELVREISAQRAAAEQERIAADSAPELGDDGTMDTSEPRRVEDYVADLRSRNLPLDFETLTWKKKIRCDGDRRGNLGWFVNDGGEKRYFIHRGRSTTVRRAVPRSLLQAWRDKTGRHPCQIELDYQIGMGRGNHAWYLRSYDGSTWRITLGGQGKDSPTVTLLEE